MLFQYRTVQKIRKVHAAFQVVYVYYGHCLLPETRHGSTKVPGRSFLRDVAHYGVLCTFSNRSASDRGKVWSFRSGGMDRPSPTKSLLCCVTLLQSARRAAVLDQPSIAFGLIFHATHRKYTIINKKTYPFCFR